MGTWGGKRDGAGRKPTGTKAELITALGKYIEDEDVVKALRDKIIQGDMRAIRLYFEMKYGKPSTQIEVTQVPEFQSISFKDVLKFD